MVLGRGTVFLASRNSVRVHEGKTSSGVILHGEVPRHLYSCGIYTSIRQYVGGYPSNFAKFESVRIKSPRCPKSSPARAVQGRYISQDSRRLSISDP